MIIYDFYSLLFFYTISDAVAIFPCNGNYVVISDEQNLQGMCCGLNTHDSETLLSWPSLPIIRRLRVITFSDVVYRLCCLYWIYIHCGAVIMRSVFSKITHNRDAISRPHTIYEVPFVSANLD